MELEPLQAYETVEAPRNGSHEEVVIELELFEKREGAEQARDRTGEQVHGKAKPVQTDQVGKGIGNGTVEGVVGEVEFLEVRKVPDGQAETARVSVGSRVISVTREKPETSRSQVKRFVKRWSHGSTEISQELTQEPGVMDFGSSPFFRSSRTLMSPGKVVECVTCSSFVRSDNSSSEKIDIFRVLGSLDLICVRN